MEARNRKIGDWYGKVKRGEIKLPRFQRYEAWNRHQVRSLLETVIRNLPLGITLILEVDKEKFISRFLETAPTSNERIHEHLLDGQQRLTALWRTLQNNYQWETYYIYIKSFDTKEQDLDDMTVFCRGRYKRENGDRRYPLWCDAPAQCLQRGYLPTDLLKPEDIQKRSTNG